jgi:hypothetical protein
MNILKILMNTQFTPFAEFDYETYGGASEHAKIGEYRDMVIVIEGSALDPSSIEVFDKSGECIYSGYVTKDGLGIRQYDARGLRS